MTYDRREMEREAMQSFCRGRLAMARRRVHEGSSCVTWMEATFPPATQIQPPTRLCSRRQAPVRPYCLSPGRLLRPTTAPPALVTPVR